MPMSDFPHGFTSGVTIRDLPLQAVYPGNIYWVNNSSILAAGGSIAGSDNAKGTYRYPFQTLEGALANSNIINNAGRGDIIMIMPNHAETISNNTLMSLSNAGVLIYGLGSGNARPTFTLQTATSATINVTANNCGISNCRFIANFANISSLFTLTTAKNFYLGYNDFIDTSSILNFVSIVQTDTTSNDADGLWVENNKFYGLGAQSNTCLINAKGTNDRWTIRNNYVTHTAVTGGGFMQTASGKNITNLICDNNKANLTGASGLTTGTFIIAGGTSNTGVISNNMIKSLDDTTPILVTASSGWTFYNNLYQVNADKSGFLLPALDT